MTVFISTPFGELPDIGVAEELEDPRGVGGPPVGAVAVNDDGVLARDAARAHQLGEGGAVDEVAAHGVVEVAAPIDAQRTRDVADVVQEGVLVGLDDFQPVDAEARGQPRGGDELFGVGELLEQRVRVMLDAHAVPFLGRVRIRVPPYPRRRRSRRHPLQCDVCHLRTSLPSVTGILHISSKS